MITQSEVRELFDYRDGDLYWRVTMSNRNKAGNKIKKSLTREYYRVGIKGKNYLAHRLVFLYHHGYIPEMIDHVDSDTTNNRIENLRPCNKAKNSFNSKMPITNTSGTKGVRWNELNNNWRVTFRSHGETIEVGSFTDKAEAILENSLAREKHHGEFARV